MNKMIKRGLFALILAAMSIGSIAQAGRLTIFTTRDGKGVILTPLITKAREEVLSGEYSGHGAPMKVVKKIYDQKKDTKPFLRVWVSADEFWGIVHSCHGHYNDKFISSNRAQLMPVDAKLLYLLNNQ